MGLFLGSNKSPFLPEGIYYMPIVKGFLLGIIQQVFLLYEDNKSDSRSMHHL